MFGNIAFLKCLISLLIGQWTLTDWLIDLAHSSNLGDISHYPKKMFTFYARCSTLGQGSAKPVAQAVLSGYRKLATATLNVMDNLFLYIKRTSGYTW